MFFIIKCLQFSYMRIQYMYLHILHCSFNMNNLQASGNTKQRNGQNLRASGASSSSNFCPVSSSLGFSFKITSHQQGQGELSKNI